MTRLRFSNICNSIKVESKIELEWSNTKSAGKKQKRDEATGKKIEFRRNPLSVQVLKYRVTGNRGDPLVAASAPDVYISHVNRVSLYISREWQI